MKRKVIIMGAAGRDFHNFNVFFRDNGNYEVVCFTAEQIPNISGRKYPKELSGKLYPDGIPIYSERDLPNLIRKHNVDIVVLAYSDLSYEDVMHKASLDNSLGADFILMGSKTTMLKSKKPLVSVCAVRTGCGKSQTSRRISKILREMGHKVVVIRHPMPYGDLRKQISQRFADYGDLYRHECTIEEREEYEQHIKNGFVVYAGVDYGKILKEAEREADIILWDGGNNDTPFFKPNLHIVVVDPHRPGHGIKYYPGETNLRMAKVVVISKEGTAKKEDIKKVLEVVEKTNPKAKIIHANSEVMTDEPEKIKDARVLIVEDGPTLTHGEMAYGAGWVAAKKYKAKSIVRPEKYAVGSIKEAYEKHKQIKEVLPALGYGRKQIKELEETINRTPCDIVIIATPMDLAELIKINKPSVYITYHLKEKGRPNLEDVLKGFLKKKETRRNKP
ncbi:MAG: GTPase [Candidatus Aenigmatarchaeota archaeon]|nr:MAG: GTPase [Candidatus Aenigmarchaeota archaeon]